MIKSSLLPTATRSPFTCQQILIFSPNVEIFLRQVAVLESHKQIDLSVDAVISTSSFMGDHRSCSTASV